MRILILFAHPAFHKSHVNRILVDGLDHIENLTFHDLYEVYPDFDINIKQEQEFLSEHDCIIFHHPMFWYSVPALLKEWMDLVLQHGWAYGTNGNALKDKLFFNVITTGGPKEAFQLKGMHHHTLNELLLPISLTVQKCKMIELDPFVIHGTYGMDDNTIESYKKDYHELLQSILKKEK